MNERHESSRAIEMRIILLENLIDKFLRQHNLNKALTYFIVIQHYFIQKQSMR